MPWIFFPLDLSGMTISLIEVKYGQSQIHPILYMKCREFSISITFAATFTNVKKYFLGLVIKYTE